MQIYQEIHIWDLPTEHIYIKFNEVFRENFFKLAHKKFGNFNLVGRFLNVKRPDKTIVEIRHKTNLCKRGGSSGKPIINPKLPVVVNEDFAEILGHICGDGTISKSNPKKGLSFNYINSEPTLIESFQDLKRT